MAVLLFLTVLVAAAECNPSFWLLGGSDSPNTIEYYNTLSPEKNKIIETELPDATYGRAAVQRSNVLFFTGGIVDDKTSGKSYAFDQKKQVVSPMPELLQPRFMAAAAQYKGTIYVCGGTTSGTNVTDSCERLKPNSTKFEVMPHMKEWRTGHTLTPVYDEIYALGGQGGGEHPLPASTFEAYSHNLHKWSEVKNAPKVVRWGHSAVSCQYNLYVCGGYSDSQDLASCEAFNVATQSWHAFPSMNNARSMFTLIAFSTPDRCALFAIGGRGAEQSVEFFNPVQQKWVEYETKLKADRELHVASVSGLP